MDWLTFGLGVLVVFSGTVLLHDVLGEDVDWNMDSLTCLNQSLLSGLDLLSWTSVTLLFFLPDLLSILIVGLECPGLKEQ